MIHRFVLEHYSIRSCIECLSKMGLSDSSKIMSVLAYFSKLGIFAIMIYLLSKAIFTKWYFLVWQSSWSKFFYGISFPEKEKIFSGGNFCHEENYFMLIIFLGRFRWRWILSGSVSLEYSPHLLSTYLKNKRISM